MSKPKSRITTNAPLTTESKLDSAERLHAYLLKQHWQAGAVYGPDSGVRFNARIGRFIKGYLTALPWSDNYAYIQSQAYWIFSNWLMHDLTGDPQFETLAVQGTDYVKTQQTSEGYWKYPNPEWKDRIATVEGCIGSLALVESYRRTGQQVYLEGADKFYQFLLSDIGFRKQSAPSMLAINYFAGTAGEGGGVPNNSTLLLWMLGELFDATGRQEYLEHCQPMINWLEHVQLPSGELPYALGNTKDKDRVHFLCYQYNAFEYLDLAHYYQRTGNKAVVSIMEQLAGYLKNGFTGQGACRYNCQQATPEVNYYTFSLARALSHSQQMAFATCTAEIQRAFRHALSFQRADGGFRFFSRYNYRFLEDRRSYPRNLSMMLYHLLSQIKADRELNVSSSSRTISQSANAV
ncbi:MAG: hypothetical protein GY880_30770 [Planctomycetaceae bacterium]|nr:hypothetical protein [Planctomycetaceae bacterium]